jgi:hypothetical protein
LQQQALLWESKSRSNKYLFDGSEMLNAEVWAQEHTDELNKSEKDFLESCHQAEDRRKHEREQTERIRRLAVWLGIAAVIGVIASAIAFFSYMRSENRYQELLAAIDRSAKLEKEKDDALADLNEKALEAGGLQEFRDKRLTQGQRDQAVAADIELHRLNQPEGVGRRRQSKIKISYYPRDVNPDKIRASLDALGYDINVGASKNLVTNAIWYGSEVCKTIEDVQLVAYTLMSAGIEIKIVEPLKDSKGRERLIIVGGNSFPKALDAPAKTVKDIGNLTNCVHK